jgi:hypothetical protein
MKIDKYIVRWHYPAVPFLEKNIHYTYCYLTFGDMTYAGFARCVPSDIFSKDKGRKVSLARVLKNAELPKEDRTKIWDAYRNMTAKKRW